MIERHFVAQRIKHFRAQEYIASKLGTAGFSHTDIVRTPLGEKIIIYTSRPGLVVGRKGENINELTSVLKEKFGMENPQIEVAEIEQPLLDARVVAKVIANTFERFGPKRFKSVGYKTLEHIMKAGAMGAEIVISGRGVPSTRAKSWRFSAGYLKKSGEVSVTQVKKGFAVAHLSSGAIGIKVNILTPDVVLPDKITAREPEIKVEEVKEEPKEEKKEPEEKTKEKKQETKKEKKPKKKRTKEKPKEDKQNGDNEKK